jgi:hypothetical protein
MFWLSLAGAIGVWHASSGPDLYDAGELAAAAWQLGASHPPGQPLHALVAHAFAWLPLGPLPWRMALLSTAAEVLAAWIVVHIVSTLQQPGPEHPALGTPTPVAQLLYRHAPDAAAVGFLLSSIVLRQALRIEVYGMAMALSLYGVYRGIRWMQDGRIAHLCQAVFVSMLCIAVHLPHALAPIAMLGCALFVVRWRKWMQLSVIVWTATSAICGLAFLSWLPLRAYAGAPMWGKPQTLQGVWAYVSAQAYQRNLGAKEQNWLGQIIDAIGFGVAACGILPIVGIGLLVLCAARSQRPLRHRHYAIVMGAGLALVAGCLQPLQVRNPDNIAYFGPAVALWIALGAAGFSRWSATHHNQVLSVCGLVLIALNIPTLSGVPFMLRADNPALETLAGRFTEAPPPKSLVIVETDFTAASWMMARALDGARPDVALFISGLATSSWHWQALRTHAFFDGTPRRGQGHRPMEAFNDGLIRHTEGRVPVLSEAHWPTQGRGLILGHYVYLPVDRNTRETDLSTSMAERWSRALGQDALTSPWGDYGAAMAVIRHQEVTRARRLIFHHRIDEALEALRYALRGLPASELQWLSGATVTQTHIPPPAVRDPNAFLVSKEDAVREAATLLWAIGAAENARKLLNKQLKRGDVRSVLQLAWLELAEGDLEAARRTLHAFVTVAPELAHEASPLERHLK